MSVKIFASAGVGLFASTLFMMPAYAEPCAELSYERNAIYKGAGYCFHTPDQIRNFGNAGCQFDNQRDVPLSADQRVRIGEIVQAEREMGCR